MNMLNSVYRIALFAGALLFSQFLLGMAYVEVAEAESAALKKLIKDSKAEGGTFIAHAVLDDVRGRREVEAAMTRKYGHKIKWEHLDFPSQNRFSARLLKELKAGRQPSTDIFNGTQATVPRLMDANALASVDNWRELIPRIPKDVIVPGGGAIPEHTRIGGFAYNTQLVPPDKVPKKLEDLLDPFWKGKLASTPYAAVWDRASVRDDGTFDKEKAERIRDIVKKLVENGHIVGLIGCGDESRIAAGEFVGLALICSGNNVARSQKKGAPLEMAYLEETSNISHSYMALLKKAKYPNTGKLFMVFMQTPEGQAINRKWESTDVSYYPENKMYKVVNDLKARGVAPPYISIPKYIKVKKSVRKWKGVYKKILRGQK
ncbi:MAG: ABC transporter substrate-binding protein [Candidatus Binatia bacterium]